MSASANALIIHTSLDELKPYAPDILIEDWSGYAYNTELSGTTTNGIVYPGLNSLNEPLVTWCVNPNSLRCIRYLTERGSSRSFGRAAKTFGFIQPIDAFSIYVTQGTNLRGAGRSEWSVFFDNGQTAQFSANWDDDDSYGLGYIGISGIDDAMSFTIRQIRNDVNVVWGINHIGYQTAKAVSEPSIIGLLVIAFLGLAIRPLGQSCDGSAHGK
jgi:hypothetical protein